MFRVSPSIHWSSVGDSSAVGSEIRNLPGCSGEGASFTKRPLVAANTPDLPSFVFTLCSCDQEPCKWQASSLDRQVTSCQSKQQQPNQPKSNQLIHYVIPNKSGKQKYDGFLTKSRILRVYQVKKSDVVKQYKNNSVSSLDNTTSRQTTSTRS